MCPILIILIYGHKISSRKLQYRVVSFKRFIFKLYIFSEIWEN